MKRRHRTLMLIIVAGVILLGATVLGSIAMRKTVSFFYAPNDVKLNPPKANTNIRLGGLVGHASIVRKDGGKVEFIVTDGAADVKVFYQGLLPDLFREGQGVIAEGSFRTDGNFYADRILAKHDENYMPKEVVDSLKKTGQWKGGAMMKGEPQAKDGAAKYK